MDWQIFEAKFAGEGSIDVGGPFRDTLANVMSELETETLPILIKTPNNRNNVGMNRECFMLNPASTSPIHSELFEFMGNFIGFSIRTKSAMNWHFPPSFWKQILEEPMTISDLEDYDTYSYQVLKDIEKYGQSMKPAEFNAAVMEKFCTHYSNGKEVELCPGGKEKDVTHANYKEFIELFLKVRFDEVKKQMESVMKGITFVIKNDILSFLNWDDIELRACGPKNIEIADLKAISDYNVDANHKIIKWFWEMFEKFSQEERQKYLKFVWGRAKIPSDTTNLDYRH